MSAVARIVVASPVAAVVAVVVGQPVVVQLAVVVVGLAAAAVVVVELAAVVVGPVAVPPDWLVVELVVGLAVGLAVGLVVGPVAVLVADRLQLLPSSLVVSHRPFGRCQAASRPAVGVEQSLRILRCSYPDSTTCVQYHTCSLQL